MPCYASFIKVSTTHYTNAFGVRCTFLFCSPSFGSIFTAVPKAINYISFFVSNNLAVEILVEARKHISFNGPAFHHYYRLFSAYCPLPTARSGTVVLFSLNNFLFLRLVLHINESYITSNKIYVEYDHIQPFLPRKKEST